MSSSHTNQPVVEIRGASLLIPIYGHETRSLKKTLLGLGTGGRIAPDALSGLFRVEALSGLDLMAYEGDRIGIVGPNGAGKSSLLRLIAGIYEPTLGDVFIRGTAASLLDVGLGIEDDATGRENIKIRGSLLGIPPESLAAMESSIIDFTELGPYIDLPVRTYSSGMRVRLAFAVSVCIEPDILLLDEWISTGDANFLRKAEDRLNRLISNLKVLFFASHSREILANTCNKLLVLQSGKIAYFGPFSDGMRVYDEILAENGSSGRAA
jgi:ABC-type polysaccharide/polyol phosphate transport system ATPase subunit